MTINEELSALSPESVALMKLAEESIALGRFDDAVSIYDQIISCEATGYVFAKRGFARYESGDFSGAIFDFDQAVSLRPMSPVTLRYRAMAKESLDDLEGAMRDYRSSLVFKERAETHCDIAMILEYQGLEGQAIAEFQAALIIDPGNELARNSLAKLKTSSSGC